MENNKPKSAQERKTETEKFLKALNIPYIQHLPMIEEETEVRIRKPNEIAERILILTYLSYVAEVPNSRNDVVFFSKKL